MLLYWSVAVGVAWLVFKIFKVFQSLRRNIEAADRSGIPYVVTPVYMLNRFWLVTNGFWSPLLRRLPSSWTSSWLDLLNPECFWIEKHKVFERMGSDVFLTVSPDRCILFVADADVNNQISSRRNDFPKPVELYAPLDIFGKNVLTTEGAVWRQHRKITSAPFTERNNVLVWHESLRQTQSMIGTWNPSGSTSSPTVSTVAANTMRLSLHVISRAGFGVRSFWPGEKETHSTPHDSDDMGFGGLKPPPGHSLTYIDALTTVLDHIIAIMLIPSWLRAWLPIKAVQLAHRANNEWGMYMREILESKKAAIRDGKAQDGLNLMGAFALGAGMTPESLGRDEEDSEKGSPPKYLLSDEEILGNAFLFLIAGHETVADTLHFCTLFLAMHPDTQRQLQKDLDEIFGDRSVEKWDYDTDVPKLFGSMAGAVLNEELRLVPPVVAIPKSTPPDKPQSLTYRGCQLLVPANCFVNVVTCAVQRNPRYWPGGDLDTFRPQRWLQTQAREANGDSKSFMAVDASKTTGDGDASTDTHPSMLRPPRGAYIPFSDGARSCLGRRFGQIETLAFLAAIFRDWSVELAVDEYASDEAVDAMPRGSTEREEVWTTARDKAQWLLDTGMYTILTVQLRRGQVPIRLVRRGHERFASGTY